MTRRLTIVIPTRDRPEMLARALESALAQPATDTEVVVVDDRSHEPVRLAPDPRVRVERTSSRTGVSAARNVGWRAARTSLVGFLDDDDVLLENFTDVSLSALDETELPPPVGVVSGLEVVDELGEVRRVRLPPTLERGRHWQLEPVPEGRSFLSKQTLVLPRDVLADIGGWDENLRSRVTTELFLRLNEVCSLLGVPVVTYRQLVHGGPRLSTDADLRVASFDDLVRRHRAILEAHRRGYARLLVEHGQRCWDEGLRGPALRALAGAARRSPRTVAGHLRARLRHR